MPHVQFAPNFPDTDEGKRQKEAFERFLETGEPAEIDSDFLGVSGLPIPDGFLTNEGGKICLGHTLNPVSAAQVVALVLRFEDGSEWTPFEYLEFRTKHGGLREITISNEQQATPWTFELVIPTSLDRPGRFDFRFELEGTSFATQLKATEFQIALSRGCHLGFEYVGTGERVDLFQIQTGEMQSPGEPFLDLVRRVVFIQNTTKTVIPVPDRDFFLPADVEAILSTERVLRTGKPRVPPRDFSIGTTAEGLRKLPDFVKDGVFGRIRMGRAQHSETILDTEVPLGPFELRCDRAQVAPDRLVSLGERLELADDEDVIQLPIVAAEGSQIEVTFPSWLPDHSPSEEKAGDLDLELGEQSSPGEPE